MAIEGSGVDLAKRIVELETQCEWLKEQVIKAKGEEERIKVMYVKAKGEYLEVKENFDSKKWKWREEDEKIRGKYWRKRVFMESTKAKLEEEKNLELIRKFQVLEREKEQMVAEAFKLRKEKSDEAERSFRAKRALVDARKFELMKRNMLLERIKQAMQEGVSKLMREMSEEVSKITTEKMAAEAEKRAFEVDNKKMAVLMKNKDEALEKEKKEMEAKLYRANMEQDAGIKKMVVLMKNKDEALGKEKKDLEAKLYRANMEKDAEIKKMVVLLKNKDEALEKEKKDLEAKLYRANMEKDAEIRRISKEQMASERQGQKMISERDEAINALYQKNKTLEAHIEQLEMEKIRLILKRIEDGKMVAEVSKLQKEKSGETEKSYSAKKALEAEVKRSKEVEARNFELVNRIGLLERVQKAMQDGVSNLKKDKSEEVNKILKEKMAAEAERRAFEVNSNRLVAVLMKKSEASEKEKMEIEAKNVELVKRIGPLERVQIAMQDEVSKLRREKSEEDSKRLKEKMFVEAEKKALEEEIKKIIAVLMEKLSRANLEKDAEIRRISKEQMTSKEEGQKMILGRDEAIKVLYQENRTLEAKNKQLEMEKIRLDVAHQSHSVSSVVGILATPAQKIQGDIIKIEEQTTLASACERIRLSRLSGGRSSNNSVALDYSATANHTDQGDVNHFNRLNQ